MEIWGWKEWEKIERMQERYIRWVLGIDGRTPRYIREEGKREKMRTRLGRRAMEYEKKRRGVNGRENVGSKEKGRGRRFKMGKAEERLL